MDTISEKTRMTENLKFVEELMAMGAMEEFFTGPGKVAGKRVRVKDINGNEQTLCMEVSYTKKGDPREKETEAEARERLCRGGECYDDEVGCVPQLNEEDDGLTLDGEDKEMIGLAER